MTALINKIDPNKHPKLYWTLLIISKWVLPNIVSICFAILIIMSAPLIADNLKTLNDMELTEAEEALKNLIVASVAFLGGLYFMRRLH